MHQALFHPPQGNFSKSGGEMTKEKSSDIDPEAQAPTQKPSEVQPSVALLQLRESMGSFKSHKSSSVLLPQSKILQFQSGLGAVRNKTEQQARNTIHSQRSLMTLLESLDDELLKMTTYGNLTVLGTSSGQDMLEARNTLSQTKKKLVKINARLKTLAESDRSKKTSEKIQKNVGTNKEPKTNYDDIELKPVEVPCNENDLQELDDFLDSDTP